MTELTELTNRERHERTDGPVHLYFGLSYNNYQVVPRSLAQSMPVEWQQRFVVCMQELRDAFSHIEHPNAYEVQAAEEWTYGDLNDAQMLRLNITRPDAPNDADDDDEPLDLYYDADGEEHQGWESLLIPTRDPIPHYNRGRTFVESSAVAVPVVTEWYAEQHWLDGTIRRQPAADENHAVLIATGGNRHIASMNELTREAHGVKEIHVVCREVRELADGSTLIGPWVRVQPRPAGGVS
jgi:hypothetical protein